MRGEEKQCGEGSNLYIRKNVRKPPEQRLKILFFKRSSVKSRRTFNFFPRALPFHWSK